jgi:hypothetical protein
MHCPDGSCNSLFNLAPNLKQVPALPPPPPDRNHCGWAKLLCDVTGVNDAWNCIDHPNWGDCLSAVADVAMYVVPAGELIRGGEVAVVAARTADAAAPVFVSGDIEAGETVTGRLVVMNGGTMRGTVNGNLLMMNETGNTIEGTVNGNVVQIGSRNVVGPNAVINGKIVQTGRVGGWINW